MPLSDASSEIAPSLAELTALTVAVTTVATADRPAPEALASSNTTERTVFPVTILGPTNSSNEAPTNCHDEDDVDTPHQQGNVTLRSLDVNTNSRLNNNAQRDDDDDGVDFHRRINSPPQRFLRARGRDSYDN